MCGPSIPRARAPKLFADDSVHMDAWSARGKASDTALGTPRGSPKLSSHSDDCPRTKRSLGRTGLTAPEKDQAAGHCLNVSSLICAEQCCATAMSVPPIGRWLGKRIRSPGNPWQGPPSSGCPWDKGTSLPGLVCPPISHWLAGSFIFILGSSPCGLMDQRWPRVAGLLHDQDRHTH